jgi:hypothetical protein
VGLVLASSPPRTPGSGSGSAANDIRARGLYLNANQPKIANIGTRATPNNNSGEGSFPTGSVRFLSTILSEQK